MSRAPSVRQGVCAGYQATLGFTAVPTTRGLTLVGTANQITVTPAGAQDLAANRTLNTLALPRKYRSRSLGTLW